MAPGPFETLREVNAYLRQQLACLRPERKHCLAITSQDFTAILEQLLRASECLSHSLEPSPELEREILEYRGNLEELVQLLPDLHGRLLAERARIEEARFHLSCAAAWAQARKTTV